MVSCGVRESEPENNTRRGAKLLSDGDTTRGNFLSKDENDRDFFKLDLNSKQYLAGQLSAVKGVDSKITLYPYGSEIPIKLVNDSGSSLGEQFGPILISPPGVYIEVTHVNQLTSPTLKEIPYQFEVSLIRPLEPVEFEPNDTIEQAQVLEGKVLGYYSNAIAHITNGQKEPERDYYLIPILEESKQLLEVRLSAVAGIDPVLRLMDKNGKVLRQVDERGLNQGEIIPSYGLTGKGQVYLSVTAKDQQTQMNEHYELEAKVTQYENRYEFEPNDSFEDATLLTETSTRGEFSGSSDQDYFVLQNIEDRIIDFSIEARPAENNDIKLTLLSAAGSEINVYADGKAGEPEAISLWRLQPQQKFFLKLESEKTGNSENMPYLLYMTQSTAADGHEVEPNNQPVDAMPISEGATIGYINPATDVDTYYFETEEDKSYTLKLEPFSRCIPSIRIGDNKAAFYTEKSARLENEGLTLTFTSKDAAYIQISCEQSTFGLYRNPYRFLLEQSSTSQ